MSRARVTSISSRSSALPTWNGEAERFTISCAPGEREIRRGRPGLPDVLADRRADEHVAAAEQDELAAGGEVAVLVEDAVVREVVLAVHASQLAVREHGARVREIAIEERAADERGDPLRRGGDLVERGAGGLDEARAEEQVLGRIARDGELGEEDEVGPGGACLTDRVDDERPVAGEIADDGVELREREPHRTAAMFLTARHKLHSTFMLAPLTIARRFRGPRTSANGGYASGLLAQAAHELGLDDGYGRRGDAPAATAARAAARRSTRDGERVLLLDGEALVAEARAGDPGVTPPTPPTFAEAADAARALSGLGAPVFDECFVCGTRPEGDGLEIHAGLVAGRDDGLVATTWVAKDVRPEIVWAVIDCPGAYSLHGDGRGDPLLARITARVDRLPEEGERCVVAAWPLDEDGRKRHAATALYGEDGAADRRLAPALDRAARRDPGDPAEAGSDRRRLQPRRRVAVAASAASAPRAARRPRRRRGRGRR